MRVCPACAVATDEPGRFCPACGAPLEASRIRAGTDPTDFGAAATAEIAPSSASTLVGTRIDNQFDVESVLGGGAFAVVYRARQLGIDRVVALKVPTHEIAVDPVMAKRFAREARSAARVRHPGVVTIYAVGELPDGRPYFAMELVDGEPLSAILARGPIEATRALRVARAIASALSDTHAADVIHRDLKPTNIIWRRDRNGDDRIVLVDFGIAVCKPGNADATRLTAGGLIGTPHYMSPEQAHGDPADARADLYALGCILFELVTGTTPFDGSGYEVMLAHLGKPAPRAISRTPSVPLAVDELIAHLLAKKPADRPASADAVVARIDDALVDLDAVSAATRIKAPRTKRPTAATRRDLPEPAHRAWQGSTVDGGAVAAQEMPERRARWIVGLAIATVVLTGGGFALAKLMTGAGDASAGDLAAGAQPGHRQVVRDDGETTLHMTLPEPIHAGQQITAQLQLWNKLGQPISDPPVLTIEDPRGAAKGFSPKTRAQDLFDFTRTLRASGRYIIRVFPAGTDSAFEIPIDVGAAP